MLELKNVIANGWPEHKSELSPNIAQYFNYRDELTIENGIIFRGQRIIIPKSLRADMKMKVHVGHTGINSCLRRARTYIFWPGMSDEIRQFVEKCPTCATFQAKQPEQPLLIHEIPERPYQKVATDIFTIKSRNYLITVDYYSQYFEVDFLQETKSDNVIHKLKANFARFGIPEILISDNGPQFTSNEFKNFATKWNFKHETISPGKSL